MPRIVPMLIAAALVGAVMLPRAGSAQAPSGNHANGLNYQPTPAQVLPRERNAGVSPPAAQEDAANRDLAKIDRELLRSHGLNPDSAPTPPPSR